MNAVNEMISLMAAGYNNMSDDDEDRWDDLTPLAVAELREAGNKIFSAKPVNSAQLQIRFNESNRNDLQLVVATGLGQLYCGGWEVLAHETERATEVRVSARWFA